MGHKKLIELARQKLIEKGFTDEQIFKEYSVITENSWINIDIVGISDTRKVAFEVGNVGKNRLEQLEIYFDEVFHIPYGTISEDGSRVICFVCGYKWKARVKYPKACPFCKIRLNLNEPQSIPISELEVN